MQGDVESMVYECLFYNSEFVISKLLGWPWSSAERQSPFEMHLSPEMHVSETDYQVDVNGKSLWASQIDPLLVESSS